MDAVETVGTNSTSNDFPGSDFFELLYLDSLLKQITLIIFFLGAIVGLISEVAIIWYERNGNHQYRTVINQLFSTISWLVVAYILFVYIPEGVRYLTGPLSTSYCDIHNFLKNFIWSCTILTLDGIILLRYIFIFKWKRATVNDNLIACFLQLTILLASLWTAAVKLMSKGRMPLNYYMCAGRNPDDDPETGARKHPKLDTLSILVCVSFALHIFVVSKIFFYQRKMEQKMESIQLGCINSKTENQNRNRILAWTSDICSFAPMDKMSLLPKSMADLTTQILALTVHVVMAILLIIMNGIEPIDLNKYRYRWIVYTIQIIGVAAASVTVHALYFVRNVSYTKAIWRRITNSAQGRIQNTIAFIRTTPN